MGFKGAPESNQVLSYYEPEVHTTTLSLPQFSPILLPTVPIQTDTELYYTVFLKIYHENDSYMTQCTLTVLQTCTFHVISLVTYTFSNSFQTYFVKSVQLGIIVIHGTATILSPVSLGTLLHTTDHVIHCHLFMIQSTIDANMIRYFHAKI